MEKRFFGTDPEFFVYNMSEKSKSYKDCNNIPNIIPPASLITDYNVKFTNSKNNKRILLDRDDYRFIEDGSALEINFKQPFNDIYIFNRMISTCLQDINYFLHMINYNFSLSKEVLGFFDIEKYWKNRDKSFTDCVRFGCDPDIFPNYYLISGFENEVCKEIDASTHEYRYAGGHIHIQNMSENPDIYLENIEIAPIVFDFLVGTSNIILNKMPNIINQEKVRLNFYGRPGRVRLQKYSKNKNGIEYRPPSNNWIFNPYFTVNILNSAFIAANIIENNGGKDFFNTFQDRIPDMWSALTNCDKDLSKRILTDSLTWAYENNYTTLSEVENVITSNQN